MLGNGCSGDVRLDKDERGYEHWGLVPHVSFRDGEDMQPLTGHRQSGGVSCVVHGGGDKADLVIGTIVFYDHVSHGIVRDGPSTVLTGRRDQPGKSTPRAPFPPPVASM